MDQWWFTATLAHRYTLERFFFQEDAINYKAAILVGLGKMVFILAQEEEKKTRTHPQTFNLWLKPGSFLFVPGFFFLLEEFHIFVMQVALFVKTLLGYLSLQVTTATKDTQSDITLHLHGAHPMHCRILSGGLNNYYWFLWNFGSCSPGSIIVAPPQESMNHCDIWQPGELQCVSQANGKCLPVCESLFGEPCCI